MHWCAAHDRHRTAALPSRNDGAGCWLEKSVAIMREQAMQRRDAVEPAHLVAHTVGAQEVADRATRADDAQRNAAGRTLALEIVEHARTREVDVRRCRQIA